MAQHQEFPRTAGRGGAGNHHPASALEHQPQSAEATAMPPAQDLVFVAPPDAPGPLRGGRGGAGNFVDPVELPDPSEAAREVGAAVLTATRSRSQKGRGGRGMAGRGGAGNWAGRPAGRNGSIGADDDDDGGPGPGHVDDEWDEVNGPHAQKVEALERRVQEVVDKGLRMPDKVHHGRDKSGHE